MKAVYVRQRRQGKAGKHAFVMVAEPGSSAVEAKIWVTVTEKQSTEYLTIANEIKSAIDEGCTHVHVYVYIYAMHPCL